MEVPLVYSMMSHITLHGTAKKYQLFLHFRTVSSVKKISCTFLKYIDHYTNVIYLAISSWKCHGIPGRVWFVHFFLKGLVFLWFSFNRWGSGSIFYPFPEVFSCYFSQCFLNYFFLWFFLQQYIQINDILLNDMMV